MKKGYFMLPGADSPLMEAARKRLKSPEFFEMVAALAEIQVDGKWKTSDSHLTALEKKRGIQFKGDKKAIAKEANIILAAAKKFYQEQR